MKSLLKQNSNLSVVQKICLTGLLIALATICQKVFAINYIPVVPFLRVSIGGPAIIIFASIFLGPFYGLAVGAFSDLLGYLLFDPKKMGFFPQITAIYALLGFASYFIYLIFKNIRSKKLLFIIKYTLIISLLVGVSLFMFLNEEIALYTSTYSLNFVSRIITVSAIVALTIITEIVITLLRRNSRVKENIENLDGINVALIIIEVVIMVGFGTLMKGFAFGFETYPAILFCQILVLFFNIPLNLFLISLFLNLTRKYR